MTVHVQDRTIIHKGRVFDVTVENVNLPNGILLKMEIIRHPGASAIVAINESNDVLMLKQYRHAVGRYMWEIPAGTVDGREAPLACARRELIEETGYDAKTWEPLGTVTPVPGYSDEKIHLFLARDLIPSAQQLDPDEIIEVQPLPVEQVVSMIMKGEIDDAKTIAAFFRAWQLLRADQ